MEVWVYQEKYASCHGKPCRDILHTVYSVNCSRLHLIFFKHIYFLSLHFQDHWAAHQQHEHDLHDEPSFRRRYGGHSSSSSSRVWGPKPINWALEATAGYLHTLMICKFNYIELYDWGTGCPVWYRFRRRCRCRHHRHHCRNNQRNDWNRSRERATTRTTTVRVHVSMASVACLLGHGNEHSQKRATVDCEAQTKTCRFIVLIYETLHWDVWRSITFHH